MLLLVAYSISAQEESFSESIRSKVELLREIKDLQIGDAHVASVSLLPEIYERRNFKPLWTNSHDIEVFFSQAADAYLHGLNPQDYHLTYLQFLQLEVEAADPSDVDMRADFDILLTDSLIRLGYHYLFGKVDPVAIHPKWNMTGDLDDRDPAQVIPNAVDTHILSVTLDSLKPNHFFYIRMKEKLAEYRQIAEKGGWRPVPAGKTLKKGRMGPRVERLRKRLLISGDLSGAATIAELFDENLEQAVRKFQARHRLYVDGVAGKNTLAAMNVPVEKRIDQIRINLERLRWVLHQIPETFVIADIAGFEVLYVHQDDILWRGRAQIGQPYRATPCFRSDIKYVEINPTWTIPPGILTKYILPAVKRDPAYLKNRNIRVLNRNGEVVAQKNIKWSRYNARNFPYILRQDPGPNNALGRVKIIFPNRHFVFIHDTPSKSLFNRSERAFSSGCIRVERPFELTGLVLNDPEKWSPENLDKVVASKKTRAIFLKTRIPAVLVYETAHAEDDGTLVFKKDVYNRDAALLKALDKDIGVKP